MAASESMSAGLVPVNNLQEFFNDSLDAAMAVNRVSIDAQTAHYVVNLLTEFSRSESFYEPGPDGPQLRPLALMLGDAAEASTDEERHCALQRVGDVALFLSGFFADGLHRTAVGPDYYMHVGGGAYNTLSGSIRGTVRGQAYGDVFAELAGKFSALVDVLQEMRDATRANTDQDTLRLYELWSKTGSPRAARLLRELGIFPIGSKTSSSEH